MQKTCIDCGQNYAANSNRQLRCEPCKKALVLQRVTTWYQANKDRKRAYDAKRREEKPEVYRAASKRWREAHAEKKIPHTQKKRARTRVATPTWANPFFIKEAYTLAKLRTRLTGIRWSVDHIVPIGAPDVCGLHVEHNLQVIPLLHNMRKGVHYELKEK